MNMCNSKEVQNLKNGAIELEERHVIESIVVETFEQLVKELNNNHGKI